MRTGKFDAAPSWLCVVLTFGRLIYSVKETVLTMSTSGYQPHVGTSQHWAQMRSHWQVSLCEVQVDFQKHLPRPKSDSLIFRVGFPTVVHGYLRRLTSCRMLPTQLHFIYKECILDFLFRKLTTKKINRMSVLFPLFLTHSPGKVFIYGYQSRNEVSTPGVSRTLCLEFFAIVHTEREDQPFCQVAWPTRTATLCAVSHDPSISAMVLEDYHST